jgi:replication initiation protein RepC
MARLGAAQMRYMRDEDRLCLPEGMSRDRFGDLIKRVARALPCPIGKPALASFMIMIRATKPSNWTPGGEAEPCCYMSQTEMAYRADVSPTRIRAHEAELVAAGLIEKRCMGNGARSGFRKSGIYFTPTLARIDEFLALDAALSAEHEQIAQLCGLRSTHKRQLKLCIETLTEQLGAAHKDVQGLIEAYSALPRADRLASMGIPALSAHVEKIAQVVKEALILCKIPSKTSGQPHETERSITKEQNNTPNVICNEYVPKLPVDKSTDTNLNTELPSGSKNCRESEKFGAAPAQNKEKLLKYLTPDRLFGIASPDMQLYLEAERDIHGDLSFYAFELAAQRRLPELGISPSAWLEASNTMGPHLATLCILTLDANHARSDLAVRNPGGYLRGMTRAHQAGKLNIIGSLLGLVKRGR